MRWWVGWWMRWWVVWWMRWWVMRQRVGFAIVPRLPSAQRADGPAPGRRSRSPGRCHGKDPRPVQVPERPSAEASREAKSRGPSRRSGQRCTPHHALALPKNRASLRLHCFGEGVQAAVSGALRCMWILYRQANVRSKLNPHPRCRFCCIAAPGGRSSVWGLRVRGLG